MNIAISGLKVATQSLRGVQSYFAMRLQQREQRFAIEKIQVGRAWRSPPSFHRHHLKSRRSIPRPRPPRRLEDEHFTVP